MKIQALMDELLDRLKFDIKNQPPQHLPEIARAMIILHGYSSGQIRADEQHIYEINLLKNVSNQVRSFGQGGDQNNGGRKA